MARPSCSIVKQHRKAQDQHQDLTSLDWALTRRWRLGSQDPADHAFQAAKGKEPTKNPPYFGPNNAAQGNAKISGILSGRCVRRVFWR